MFWAQMAQFRGVLSDCLPRPCLRINTSHHAAAFIWWEDKLRRDAKKRSSRPLNTDASAVAKKEASHIDSGVKTKDTSRSGHKLGKILILFHPKPMTSYINLQHTAAGKGCLQCKVSGQWAFNLSKCLDQQPGGNPVLCRVQLNTWTESTTAEVSSIWSLNQLLGHHEKPSVCTSGRPQLGAARHWYDFHLVRTCNEELGKSKSVPCLQAGWPQPDKCPWGPVLLLRVVKHFC